MRQGSGGRSQKKRPRVIVSVEGRKLTVPIPSPVDTADVQQIMAEVERRGRAVGIIGAPCPDWKVADLRLNATDGGVLLPTDRCVDVIRDTDLLFATLAPQSAASPSVAATAGSNSAAATAVIASTPTSASASAASAAATFTAPGSDVSATAATAAADVVDMADGKGGERPLTIFYQTAPKSHELPKPLPVPTRAGECTVARLGRLVLAAEYGEPLEDPDQKQQQQQQQSSTVAAAVEQGERLGREACSCDMAALERRRIPSGALVCRAFAASKSCASTDVKGAAIAADAKGSSMLMSDDGDAACGGGHWHRPLDGPDRAAGAKCPRCHSALTGPCILPSCTPDVTPVANVDGSMMTIAVKSLNGNAWTASVTGSDTILTFKRRLAEKSDGPGPYQAMRLIFGGKILEDEKTVAHYGLSSSAPPLFCVINPEVAAKFKNSTPSPTSPVAATTTTTSAPSTAAVSAGGAVACELVVGECGHALHAHCLLEHRAHSDLCPSCNAPWRFQSSKPPRAPVAAGSVASSAVATAADDGNRSDGKQQRALTFVVMSDGRPPATLTIREPQSTSLRQLKQEAAKLMRLSPANQLMHRSTVLLNDPDKTVAKAGLMDGAILCFCGCAAHSAPLAVTVSRSQKSGEAPSVAAVAEGTTTRTTLDELKQTLQNQLRLVPDAIELTDARTGQRLSEADGRMGELDPEPTLALTLRVVAATKKWVDLWTARGVLLPHDLDAVSTLTLLRDASTAVPTAGLTITGPVVYAVIRHVPPSYVPPKCGVAGFEGMFALANAWKPVDQCTPKGMSCFLSCLYVIANALSTNNDRKNRILGRFRQLVEDFPPTIAALKVSSLTPTSTPPWRMRRIAAAAGPRICCGPPACELHPLQCPVLPTPTPVSVLHALELRPLRAREGPVASHPDTGVVRVSATGATRVAPVAGHRIPCWLPPLAAMTFAARRVCVCVSLAVCVCVYVCIVCIDGGGEKVGIVRGRAACGAGGRILARGPHLGAGRQDRRRAGFGALANGAFVGAAHGAGGARHRRALRLPQPHLSTDERTSARFGACDHEEWWQRGGRTGRASGSHAWRLETQGRPSCGRH